MAKTKSIRQLKEKEKETGHGAFEMLITELKLASDHHNKMYYLIISPMKLLCIHCVYIVKHWIVHCILLGDKNLVRYFYDINCMIEIMPRAKMNP